MTRQQEKIRPIVTTINVPAQSLTVIRQLHARSRTLSPNTDQRQHIWVGRRRLVNEMLPHKRCAALQNHVVICKFGGFAPPIGCAAFHPQFTVCFAVPPASSVSTPEVPLSICVFDKVDSSGGAGGGASAATCHTRTAIHCSSQNMLWTPQDRTFSRFAPCCHGRRPMLSSAGTPSIHKLPPSPAATPHHVASATLTASRRRPIDLFYITPPPAPFRPPS